MIINSKMFQKASFSSSSVMELDTQGCCFFCLKEIVKVEPDLEFKSVKDTFSIHALCNWLKSGLNKLKPQSPDGNYSTPEVNSASNSKVEVSLCKSCRKYGETFSNLLLQFDKIKMEMDYCVVKISEVIKEASESPMIVRSFTEKMASDEKCLSNLDMVNHIRNQITEKADSLKYADEVTHSESDPLLMTEDKEANLVKEVESGTPQSSLICPAPPHIVQVKCEIDPHAFEEEEVEGDDESSSSPFTFPQESFLSGEEEEQVASIPQIEEYFNEADNDEPNDNDIYVESDNPEDSFNSSGPVRPIYPQFVKNLLKERYDCPSCDKDFAGVDSIRDHYACVHLNLKMKCDICGKDLNYDRSNFRRHRTRCLKKFQENHKVYLANAQRLQGTSKPTLLRKNRDPTQPNALKTQSGTMSSIVPKSNPSTSNVCKYCQKVFSHISHYKRHEPVCWKRSLKMEQLRCQLAKKDKTLADRTCRVCKKVFPFAYYCRRHQVKCAQKVGIQTQPVIEEEPEIQIIETSTSASTTEISNEPKNPRTCRFCKRVFSSRSPCQVHEVGCEKRTKKMELLKIEMAMQNKDLSEYTCLFCMKFFGRKGQCKGHMVTCQRNAMRKLMKTRTGSNQDTNNTKRVVKITICKTKKYNVSDPKDCSVKVKS